MERTINNKKIENIYKKKDSYKTYIIVSIITTLFIFISLFFNVVKFKYENTTIIAFTYIDYIKLIFNMKENIDINKDVIIFLYCFVFNLVLSFSAIIYTILLTCGGNNWKNYTLKVYKKRPYEKYINTIILAVVTLLCLIYHFVVFDYFATDEIEAGLGFYSFIVGAISSIILSILDINIINIELELNKYKKIKEQTQSNTSEN